MDDYQIERAIRRACEARLPDLPLPIPFHLDTFVAQIAARRKRPIERFGLPLGGGLPGMWVETHDQDLIYYESRTAPPHQEQIILHELGHIVLGHRGITLPCTVSLGDLTLADLRALHGASYTWEQEYAAETLATLIGQVAQRTRVTGTAVVDSHTVRILRVLDSLEGGLHG